MGVYHITYTQELNEVCLYVDGECQFNCHGCITRYYPWDYHLKEDNKLSEHKNNRLTIYKVISYLKSLPFKKAIFLGKEPTQDEDFLPLAKILKEDFSSYNILLTNGYQFIEDKVIDEVCVSIKAITQKLFKDFTGKDKPEQVLDNFKKYANTPSLKIRAESVLTPGYIDKDEIEKIAKFISEVNIFIPYRIDAYIPSGKDKFRRPTEEEIKETKAVAERHLDNVSILHYGVKVKYGVERIY